MLYIFDATEKLIETLPEGSFFDAIHREVLNGENTFEFTIPAGSEYVIEGNLVGFRDLDSYWQVFEIKRLVDQHGDGLTRTAYCEHIFYELLDDIVIDKRPSADATAALAGMLENTRWQVGVVDDLGASSTSAYYESALSAVQKVANAWKGELNWRCVIEGGVITRYLDLLAMRGTDTGKQFAYSKDILNIEREVDSSGVVTALYGRGKGVETESGAYGRRLTFADVEAPGKPLGQEWIGDNDALARWGRPGGRHRFDVFIDEEETDPVKLLEKTKAELDRRKAPRVTYRLDVVSLEELTGYEHEKVRLGDLVRVIDREFEPELVVSARVIEIERDILDPANTKVVLGSFAPTIVEATLNTAKRLNEMANRPFNTKWLDGKINVLQNAIENTQSYVFQTGEDGILILDAPTYDQATKAMKLGGGIFAIANQKDGEGGWNWRTFGDGSGFTADLITAGIIDAGLITVGPDTTFAPGYDPTLIDPSASATMGVDSDCLGLWHFDGSLNSHKGVSAIGDENFDTGCFGQAVKVEEGTTNLVTNPFFDTLTGWRAHTNGAISLTSKIQYGSNACKLALTANGATRLYTTNAVTLKAGKKYVGSILVDLSGGLPWQRLNILTNTGSGVLSPSSQLKNVDLGNGLWLKSYLFEPTEDKVGNLGILTASGTTGQYMIIDAMQLEEGTTSTPFVDGTRLGVLKAPTSGLSPSQGTINFRAKNLSASANGSVLIDLPDNAGNQGMICGIADDGKLFIEDAKLQFQSVETSQADFNTGTLSDVQATSAGNLELVRDGQDFSYAEASQSDFNSGTLTNVTATSEGNLELEYTPGETTYGTDFTGNGTYSADSESHVNYSADKAFDNDTATFWYSAFTVYPHWVKVDLGSDTTKTARKLRIYKDFPDFLKTFKLQGSNDDSAWTDIYSDVTPQSTGWLEYTFDNSTAYRYYRIYGTDAYDGQILMLIAEIELMEGVETQGAYATSGTRETIVDLSGSVSSGGTNIEWLKTTPAGTAVKVEAALSTDGGSTYGSYQTCTSGSSIPGIASDTDLSNARLKIKETLSTTDTSKTPQLHSLNLNVYASYKSSGYRYKIYDISAVGEVGSSQISWTENKPANTTLTVKAAVSTDGGTTYGSFQNCTSGSAIPGLTQGMDISNARLKVQEDLGTSDGTKTPQLQELTIDVGSNVQTAYGPNKSTLTGWDSISLAWKPERLSLVVNDTEACYIENPGLPTAFGSYVYIGTDRNGANAINTLVDELRIDKVYREVNIRAGWHKTGVPFYTSEDMKQWPGYLKAETDGLKVYDAADDLRVLVGSWLKDAVRKYGIKIVDGEIYSSIVRSGAENATEYIQFNPPNNLEVYYDGALQMLLEAVYGGSIYFYHSGEWVGLISGYVSGGDIAIAALDTGKVQVAGDLYVNGSISKTGSYSALEPTKNYGNRLLYAAECPELKYYDSGVINLQNGEATVHLDQIFLECIEPDTELTPWQIWVQCYGENDVYVAEVGTDYFVIKERNGGTSNNNVIWRFEAIRKNYAGIRLMEVV